MTYGQVQTWIRNDAPSVQVLYRDVEGNVPCTPQGEYPHQNCSASKPIHLQVQGKLFTKQCTVCERQSLVGEHHG